MSSGHQVGREQRLVGARLPSRVGALRWQRGRRTKGDPARIFGNGTQATCIRPTGSKSWGRRQPFVQVRWTSLCGEMAGRDGPALAVRSPRAHSPLQHGAREPDADHTSDRPPCVAGSRPSMRSAVRAHAHRSRSSRTLRRAQLGRLLVVGAQRRKKKCALQSPYRRHRIARTPDPPRGIPSAQPSVRAAAAPANLCFLTGASR